MGGKPPVGDTERLRRADVLNRRRILGELCQSRRFRQVHVGNQQPVDGVERILGRETNLLHGLDPLHGGPDVFAVRPRELLHDHGHPRGVRGVLHGFQGPGLSRLDSALNGLGEEISRDNPLRHARRHAVDAMRSAPSRTHGSGLDARQTGVDALDRGAGLVGINLDDELDGVNRRPWELLTNWVSFGGVCGCRTIAAVLCGREC